MVAHNFDFQQLKAIFDAKLSHALFNVSFDVALENLIAVFGCKNKVVIEIVHRVFGALNCH